MPASQAKSQPALFDEKAIPYAPGEEVLYAQVVFNRPLRIEFSYEVPPDLTGRILPGKRVLAPFGRGSTRTTGFCVGVTSELPDTDPAKLKRLHSVTDEVPLLNRSMLRLTKWIADHYLCGWGQVLDAVLPRAVKVKSGTRWVVLLTPLAEDERPDPEDPDRKLTPKQRRAFETLLAAGKPCPIKEVSQNARCGPDVVKALIQKGWAGAKRERVFQKTPRQAAVEWDKPHKLGDEQKAALDRILEAVKVRRGETFLLHGVTGSGKTEVYLQAIAEVVKRKQEAIVLVPEIALTPQTIERFRKRFDNVAVLHSHLTDAERSWYWQRIAAGQIDVIVGARSAIFAPCPDLGLIVLDEEHETTFKQENTPRYHARDVARKRSILEGVPLVLGTATPSLESWHACQQGRATLLTLAQRVRNLAMPAVRLVDLKEEYQRRRGQVGALSQILRDRVEEVCDAGGQVILLLNRRGFSTSLVDMNSGEAQMCEHCDIAVTYHRQYRALVCHTCDAEYPVPAVQEGSHLRFSGFGTERLEQEVKNAFPNRTSARMDSDVMRSARHYEQILGAFRKGDIDILLGTQMIAKGLDFPNVHLVGVISADTARNVPDFRAGERTFGLVSQVAGRTGRGDKPGTVLVQTFNPDDPILRAAKDHDYHRFVELEIPHRRDFGYPPFTHLTRVIVRSKELAHADQAANLLADALRKHLSDNADLQVLGPAPAPVPKVKDYHRFHFQLHSAQPGVVQPLLEKALAEVHLPTGAEVAVDVDPVSMM